MPASSVPMNFKDFIETKAKKHNIVFMLVIAKQSKGKQLSLARYIYQVTRLELY